MDDIISRQAAIDALDMKKLKLEEAITILQDMRVDIPLPKAAVTQIKRNVALDMAIDALKCLEMPNSSQCISRQAAIDAIENTDCELSSDVWDELTDAIMNVSSAQPEIIRCKDCKYLEIDAVSHIHWCRGYDVFVSDDHYCGYAERKEVTE